MWHGRLARAFERSGPPHSNAALWRMGAAPMPGPATRHLTGWLYFGHFGVVVFIVLSGFCLMLPVVRGDGTLRGGIAAFFKRRTLRIVPPYYVAIGLSLLLIVTLIGNQTGTH